MAHRGMVLPIRNIPVPLDNDTYTYMNFNNNLVGTINPTYPTINHNNTIYNEDSFEPIMVEGKHGMGISIDEHTENVVLNTNLDTEWSKQYCSDIRWNDTQPPEGVASQVVSFIGNNTSYYWYSYGDYAPQIPNTTYTVSMYVKTLDSNFRINFYTADNSETGRYNSENIVVPNDGEWHRVVWNSFLNSIGSQSDSLSFNFSFGNVNGELQRTWFCAPQMERKNYATSFTEGTRNPSYLTYNIDTNPKTISFWFKSNSNKTANRTDARTLLLLGNELGSEDSLPYVQCLLTCSDDVRFGGTINKVGLVASIGSDYYCRVNDIDAVDGEWHHVVIEINKAKKVALWVDGRKSESAVYPSETYFGSTLRVGHSYIPSTASDVYTGLANCTFDDVCIRTAHYGEDEILQWYYSDREHYNPYNYSITI